MGEGGAGDSRSLARLGRLGERGESECPTWTAHLFDPGTFASAEEALLHANVAELTIELATITRPTLPRKYLKL